MGENRILSGFSDVFTDLKDCDSWRQLGKDSSATGRGSTTALNEEPLTENKVRIRLRTPSLFVFSGKQLVEF